MNHVRTTQIQGLIGMLWQIIDYCETQPEFVDEDLNEWAEAANYAREVIEQLEYAKRRVKDGGE